MHQQVLYGGDYLCPLLIMALTSKNDTSEYLQKAIDYEAIILRERRQAYPFLYCYTIIMSNWKDNISFVLIEPKEPGNIGASARAIKNMGFRRLELVGKGDIINDESRWMACSAIDVLERVKVFKDLKSAIAEKKLIVGTTRRIGKRRGLIVPVIEGARFIRNAAVNNRVAILFGREDKGLFNEEVEECGILITIPTDKSSPSLNLAQAVLLIAYELNRGIETEVMPALVRHEELQVLYNRIEKTLKALEYIPRGNRDLERKIMRNLKHLIGRAGLTDWELRMLHGICSQVEKKIGSSKEEDKDNDL